MSDSNTMPRRDRQRRLLSAPGEREEVNGSDSPSALDAELSLPRHGDAPPTLERAEQARELARDSAPPEPNPRVGTVEGGPAAQGSHAALVSGVLPPKRPAVWKRLLITLTAVTAGLIALGAVAVALVLNRYAEGLPDVQELKEGYAPPQITRIYSRDETLLASLFTERRTVIPFEHVPDATKLAFLAAEDASFYEHEGLNYFGILRALVANVRAGRMVQGGSTITQQVVKNVLLTSERSLRRKVRETVLAGRLERTLSKDEIFWLYLNHIYLGHGRYGIEEAARYYFGKKAKELSLDEAAVLAGLVASPERFSPRKDPDKALSRRSYVLGQMHQKGFVTEALYKRMMAAPLRLAPAAESESKLAPEMVEEVSRVLRQALPNEAKHRGLRVETTIDPELQAAARTAVRSNLDAYMARHKLRPPYIDEKRKAWKAPFVGKPSVYRSYTGTVSRVEDRTNSVFVRVGSVTGRVLLSLERRYNPGRLPPSKFTREGALLRVSITAPYDDDETPMMRLELGPESALVALDVRTREVLALVGSYDAVSGGLDRASRAQRQPGSTFKPFVYSYALHARAVTPASLVPLLKLGHGVPKEGKRQLSVRAALAHSNNEAAEKLLDQAGAEAVIEWARALGIHSPLEPTRALALGAYEVKPLELANAYVTFASGGIAGSPRFLRKAQTAEGQDLELPARPPEREVMSKQVAYLTTSLLRSVVERGTGRAARALNFPVAGKTGTTNLEKDAWFVGYSTNILAVVWVGYDDPLPLGRGESGARAALPAWISFMKKAHAGRPPTDFPRPSGVLSLDVDPGSGLLPALGQEDLVREEFLAGTEPTAVAQQRANDAGAASAAPAEPPPDPDAPPPPF